MRSLFYASAALPFLAVSALANPHQTNTGGNQVSQSQVYGDGSSANSNQAYGGRSTATGGNSRSYSRGGAGGNAASSQTVNVNGGYGGSGGYGGNVPAPDVVLPNVAGGMNACLGGVGFGGAGQPGGGLFSYTWEMHDCRMRETGQMLWNTGYRDQALRVWCQIPEVRDAFRGTPQQCPADGPPAITQTSAPPNQKYKYDYCYTSSAGELKQHEECKATPQ